MIRTFLFRTVVLATAALLWTATASGDAIPLDVEMVVSRMVEVNPIVRAAGHETARSAQTLRKARAQRILPETKVTVSTGLVPEARGTIFTSPDDYDDLDGMGPFYRAELKLVQPLFTFGKLAALVDGASRGLAVSTALEDHTTQSMALETIRAYWGLSAAARVEGTALDLKADYDKLLAEVEERVEDEASEVDDVDLLEIRASRYLIDKGVLDAAEARSGAVEALRVLLAYDHSSTFTTKNEAPPVSAIGTADWDALIDRAVAGHPEVRMAEEGLLALQAKVDLARARRLPDFYLGGKLQWGHAGHRDKQDNPFVGDDFNFRRVGAEVGLQWDPNLYRLNLAVTEAIEEQRAVGEKILALKAKVAADMRLAVEKVVRNGTLLESARASLRASKTWTRLAADNWDLGIGDVNRVIDAYQTRYGLQVTVIEGEYALHLSLARLAFVLGDLDLYLEWMRNGKVVL